MANKRNLKLVKVEDKKGRIHEMPLPNAQDMVQHNGWRMVFAGPNTVSTAVRGLEVTPEMQQLAHADRQLRPRDEVRLNALENQVQPPPTGDISEIVQVPRAQNPNVGDTDPDEDEAKVEAAKPRRKPRTRAPADDFDDGEKALAAVSPAVNAHASKDELADLEGEENAREPRDE